MMKVASLFKFWLMIGFAAGSPLTKVGAPSTHFDYTNPQKWEEHESNCAGQHQSPININTDEVIVTNYPKFIFQNYDLVFPESLENNGHTVELKIDNEDDEDDLPSISGGGLDDRYNFAQLHFHWDEGLLGSEHTINRQKYSAELHVVHYNTKYGSFDNAVPHADGLAVLGILIDLQARDNIAFRHLEQFDKIIDPSRTISDRLQFSVPLVDLLPDSTESFFRYNGSLTTPGCNEDVIWTVFETPIAISVRQLAKFRLLNDENGMPLRKNVRPTQMLHDRVVTYRPDPNPIQSLFSFPSNLPNLFKPFSNEFQQSNF
ncbi:alpha-carbonic anhydrase [Daphnia pulex]|uniref:Carbonic anhydrase n=1 Tax=Daphnia pulex TaxID=6669 RepID=E9FXM9_DAPPU|nr:alpha-carbonic anhydrase [Daphnia pulex]|eukprot:EFX88119.1 alpha-carbonic anhydrase [Daphnia pulex]